MKKTVTYLFLLGFLGLFFASCTKDKDGLVTPEIQEGIHFLYDGASFHASSIKKEYAAGNMFFRGEEAISKTKINFIVHDKMKEGEYNFANIYNVSMTFLPYDRDIYEPVAGKFNLYELDKETGTLKALFDCVLKNKNTDQIIYITNGSINIKY